MKYYIARGMIGDDHPSIVVSSDTPLNEEWTFIDLLGNRGLCVGRAACNYTMPNVIDAWKMRAFEIEAQPALFERLRAARRYYE